MKDQTDSGSSAAVAREHDSRFRGMALVLANAIGAIWILGGMFFFFLRFTFVFYEANAAAIGRLLKHLPW